MSASVGTGIVLLVGAALTGCTPFGVPGLGPLVGPPPRPLIPESTRCRFVGDPEPRTTAPDAKIVGAADYHMHQFANLGFGGRVLWGSSFDPKGIEPALAACGPTGLCVDEREEAICKAGCWLASDRAKCRAACEGLKCTSSTSHGHLGVTDPIGVALGQGMGHQTGGYPHFVGWPHYNTYTHQQVYHRWLRRAFNGGLKLIVMLAVSNEVLCKFLGHSHACDDMTNVKKQIEAAKKLETEIDEQNDCVVDGDGWYRIAKTPQEARKIISEGAMAVVLGVEVDTLFNCYKGGSCSRDSIRKKVDELRALGVRHVFPIHLMDNAFGGTGAQNEFFNWGNVVVNHKLLDVRDCSSEGYAFKFGDASSGVQGLLSSMAARFGVDQSKYDDHPAHCNTVGLEPLGHELVQELMRAKMIIDVDHMSTLARETTLDLATSHEYSGLVSGHSGFVELSKGHKKSEGQLTVEETRRLVGLGGLLAPILSQGDRAEIGLYERKGTKVGNDCGNSAKSFVQAYFYAVDKARAFKRQGEVVGVGFGSDLNGFAGLPSPRFGPYACGGDGKEQSGRVVYPLTPFRTSGSVDRLDESQAGHRVFDINVDGFAHVGMFPDFVAELQALGLTDDDLDPLFSSAEAYIQMWERAEGTPPPTKDEKRPPPCN